MPDGRSNTDYIYDEDRHYHELARHNRKCLIRMTCYRKRIQPRNHAQAEIENMKSNEDEQNDSRHALNRVKPIARIRIVQIVWPRLDGDHQSIDRVIN